MSPQPIITPTPTRPVLLPRQSDPYDLSSFYAELSSINAEYSSYNLDSLLAQYSTYSEYDYSSFFAQYTSAGQYDLSSLLSQYTGTQTGRAGNTARPTASSVGATNGGGGGGGGGLSTGAKIGIGVGVVVIVLLLAGLGIFLWCAGKRKGKKKATTIVAPMAQGPPPPPPQQPFQPQPQMYAPNQGYLPGYQQSPPPQQFQQVPPQYVQSQGEDPHAMGGYAKGPGPGVAELETEYHFARGGAVEIGDTEAPVEETKGWRKMIGRKPLPSS